MMSMHTDLLIQLPSRWWRIEQQLSVDTDVLYYGVGCLPCGEFFAPGLNLCVDLELFPFAYPCFQFPFLLCQKEPSPRSGFIEYNHKMQKKRYAKKIEAVSV